MISRIPTRRQFLQLGAASILSATTLRHALAAPTPLPLGLQLYSVRDLLPKDYQGTLNRIAALGYREVEAAGFYNHSSADVKQAMSTAGLRCVSAHYSYGALAPRLEETIAFLREVGTEYIICASPGFKDPTSPAAKSHTLSIDDWRWNAEEFNRIGKIVKAAGMRFGYHNHVAEFHALDGVVPYDELLKLTDPALVTFEMDCGWVTVGGGDAVGYLKHFPKRISMLHIKDFKAAAGPITSTAEAPEAAELGKGTVDFHALLAAANRGEIKHYFVEQEHFAIPPFEALKIDADYMRGLHF